MLQSELYENSYTNHATWTVCWLQILCKHYFQMCVFKLLIQHYFRAIKELAAGQEHGQLKTL